VPIHRGVRALQRLDSQHDQLCREAGVPVTGQSTWMRAVLEAMPVEPVYIELVESGRRVAGLPLALRPGRLVNAVEAPGPGITDSHWFPALDASAADRLARELAAFLHALGRWQLQVDSAPVDDPCVSALTRILPRHRVTPGDGMPRLLIGNDRSLSCYLSKNARYQGRRGAKLAAEQGLRLVVDRFDDAARIAAELPEVMEVHRLRDVDLGRVSDIDDPMFSDLYVRLVTDHARAGAVELLTVRVDDELAAYSLMFVDGTALRLWDGRLNPAFAELGLGRVSAMRMIERALADPAVSEVDFMRGEEPYKASYTNDVVPTVDLWAWSGAGPRASRRAFEAARELKRSSPALTRAWHRLRDRVR
jgi:CelD/BcsL family acetyltransferase involved in cellulose biosynthesis